MHPTLLIGLDGATFTILDPLMADGTMPFMREFTASGVSAVLQSTPNPLTPPAWTTLMTGRNPGNHGVFDFIWAEQRKSDHYFTLCTFNDIRCETIWSIVSRNGGRAGTLNYPLMSPPPQIDGYVVPGLVSWKHLRRHVFPKDIYAELKELPGFDPRVVAWDFDMEKKAAQGISEQEYEAWAEFHIKRERQWFEITRHLMKNHPCDLTSVLFDGPDKMMHMGWRFLDPASFPKQPTAFDKHMQALCRRYFNELDGFISELVTLAGPDARVLMASDHGFGPTWEVFRVNKWLEQEGYLTWKQLGEDITPQDREAYEKLKEQHFVLLDWEKTTAYARTTTSNGIYIQVAHTPEQSGIPIEEYNDFRNTLVEKLKCIVDPETGERIVKDTLLKEEAFPGSNNAQAPDITLVMRDHSFVSILDKEPIVCKRPHIDGTHYPGGIFLAKGPGIRENVKLPSMSIDEVAPTVLYSLGIGIPDDFEREVPEDIFTREQLDSHPVKAAPSTMNPEQVVGINGLDAEEEEQIFKQMRALGYME